MKHTSLLYVQASLFFVNLLSNQLCGLILDTTYFLTIDVEQFFTYIYLNNFATCILLSLYINSVIFTIAHQRHFALDSHRFAKKCLQIPSRLLQVIMA